MEALDLESGGASSSLHYNPSASPSEYFSTRVERLTQLRTEYATALEYDIEASKDHWSEMMPRRATEGGEETDEEDQREDDLLATEELFKKLQERFPKFFHIQGPWVPRPDSRIAGAWEVGEKIAEGAQGEIFLAYPYLKDGTLNTDTRFQSVMKVFKEGTCLRHLLQQWPLGMLRDVQGIGKFFGGGYSCSIESGLLLKNGRFAFVMSRCWGDLRKLIDLRMELNHNRSLPFNSKEVTRVMKDIAKGMEYLHEKNILHRDLKASNVLVRRDGDVVNDDDPVRNDISSMRPNRETGTLMFHFDVADFECSVGVVGTLFWRAPEILKAVKSPIRPIPSEVFSKKSDVYSFAMTCYEMLTGRIPFEDLQRTAYDDVINGARPLLPDGTEPWIKQLLKRCWHTNPLQRPTFEQIVHFIWRERYL